MNVDLLRLLTVFGRINPAIWDVIVPMGPRYFESVAEFSPASAVELNPQPIPPGHQIQFARGRRLVRDAHGSYPDSVATRLADPINARSRSSTLGHCRNENGRGDDFGLDGLADRRR